MQWWMSASSMSVEGGAGAGEDVAVAGGVDHHLGEDGPAALLALEDHAADGAVLHDRHARPRSGRAGLTPASSTISCDSSFSHSGSMVGDQVTMPWKAAVRSAQ